MTNTTQDREQAFLTYCEGFESDSQRFLKVLAVLGLLMLAGAGLLQLLHIAPAARYMLLLTGILATVMGLFPLAYAVEDRKIRRKNFNIYYPTAQRLDVPVRELEALLHSLGWHQEMHQVDWHWRDWTPDQFRRIRDTKQTYDEQTKYRRQKLMDDLKAIDQPAP